MSAVTADTRGRHLRDLRISVTDRCNFRCTYCMPKEVYGRDFQFLERSQLLSFDEINRLVTIFKDHGIEKIRITGGEPLVRRQLERLIEMLAQDPALDLTLTPNPSLPSSDAPLQENGLASWYGTKFHGQSTANGETYDMYAMTAAHKTMPLPSYARVRNPANGREIIVRVNDRGPFADGRVIDLSYTAALKLGVLRGVAPVQVQRLTYDDIRGGRWREGRGETIAALPPAASPVADDLAPGDSGAVDAGFWLQLGAFRSRDSALRLRRQLLDDGEAAFPAVAVFEQNGWYRVQAGPYATRGMAQQAAQAGLRQAGPDTLIVERGPSLGR